MEELIAFEEAFRRAPDLSRETLRRAKRLGLLRPAARRARRAAPRPRSGRRGWPTASAPPSRWWTRARRSSSRTRPTSTRPTRTRTRRRRPTRPKVVILGSGPNRIGQGIEFDYACVHAAFALRDAGVEAIMVNCNPETVSTDYDTSDRLYFEPLTLEDVLNIVEKEQPLGVIVQFGGPDAAQARGAARAGGRPDPRDVPGRHRPGGGPRALRRAPAEARPPAAAQRLGALGRRGGADRGPRSAIRCWCAPPTSWAAGRWRSSTRRRGSASGCGRRRTSRPTTPSSSTSSSRTRSRSTSTRSRTVTTSWSAA